MAERTVEVDIVYDASGLVEAFALLHVRVAGLGLPGRAVDRALAEWGAVELSREMRAGERCPRGRIRWLDAEGRRP